MKAFAGLALAGFLILGAAAVWMGGLNQDEGWYLYAAQMVADGRMPYRDFFYTQGPLMPLVYSVFTWVWADGGLMAARILTLVLGGAGILFAAALAHRLASSGRRTAAGVMTFILLGNNLYHLYYLAIPKTYALASLLVLIGFYLLTFVRDGRRWFAAAAALALALAAGARISLAALLAAVGVVFVLRRQWRELTWFCLGGFIGLAVVYGPFVIDGKALDGLLAAQRYHAARGGSDVVWTVGSLSRLVRWYLPVFVLLGLGVGARRLASTLPHSHSPILPLSHSPTLPLSHSPNLLPVLLAGFLAVFAVQILAPFPYEDYQVPIMALLAVYVSVVAVESAGACRWLTGCVLLTLGMTWAGSFGSPLLEKWSTNGQDRFWSLKKQKTELAQLRDTAQMIETLDPGGKELLTQDLYLAIETGRRVPQGLEMGPFAMLSDAEWRALLGSSPCELAALSGYAFAIEPPKCGERPVSVQMEYWSILKRNYQLALREENFGQNQTTLLVLKRKHTGSN